MDNIDIGRAFKAPFNDKEWIKKTLLGFLWLLLVVTAPAVYGAMVEYIKGVSEGREELPDWSDFGGKWVKGFLMMLAMFIYYLPVWLLGMILIVPGIIAAAAGGDSGSGAAGALLSGGMCLFWIIALVYIIAVAILFYGAVVNYAMKGNFGALFAFGDIMGHVRDGSGYFMAWIWAIVISIGLSFVTSILGITVIGYILVPAAMYLAFMMQGHVFGQWARKSYGVTAAPTPGGYAAPGAPTAYAPPAAPPAAPTPPAPPAAPPAAPTPPAPPAAPPAAPEPPAAPPVAPEPPAAPPAAPEPPAAPPAPPAPPATPES